MSKIFLSISCRNVLPLESSFRCAPMVFVKLKDGSTSNQWAVLGRTEAINHTVNPDYAQVFAIDYYFEQSQQMIFEVWDSEDEKGNVKQTDFIGQTTVQLGDIVAAPGRVLVSPLWNRDKQRLEQATISLRAEEICREAEFIKITIQGASLEKQGLLSPDPYLQFLRPNQNPNSAAREPWSVFHITEVQKSTVEPRYAPITFGMNQFCAGDYHRPVLIRCWDENALSSDKLIGECTVTVAELVQGKSIWKPLIHPDSVNKQGYSNSGSLMFHPPSIWRDSTFLDYISGGAKVTLTMAVDLTHANGHPSHPQSLHSLNTPYGNPYQQVMSLIGSTLAPYLTDRSINAFGFGCQLAQTPYAPVNDCYPLSGQAAQVHGVQGLLDAYHQAVQTTYFSGPSKLSPVLANLEERARATEHEPIHHVLICLCASNPSDVAEISQSLVRLSRLATSVLLVGVGAEPLSLDLPMEQGQIREFGGPGVVQRNLLQVVNLSSFGSVYELAQDTLKQIYDQILYVIRLENLKPLPPRLPHLAAAFDLSDVQPLFMYSHNSSSPLSLSDTPSLYAIPQQPNPQQPQPISFTPSTPSAPAPSAPAPSAPAPSAPAPSAPAPSAPPAYEAGSLPPSTQEVGYVPGESASKYLIAPPSYTPFVPEGLDISGNYIHPHYGPVAVTAMAPGFWIASNFGFGILNIRALPDGRLQHNVGYTGTYIPGSGIQWEDGLWQSA